MSKLKFVKSATKLSEFPIDKKPEIGFVGRSNAGKSSVINTLGSGRIAKVSSTPGKTRLLNLFDHKEGYRVVDMPGYGFASRGNEEVGSWRRMIESFLLERENLIGLMLIMDIRREWTDDEQLLMDLAASRQVEFGVVLTKTDKISKSATVQAKNKLIQQLSFNCCLPMSNQNREGFAELEKTLFDWVHPKQQSQE